MEPFYTGLLIILAFCLSACPFSLWIGRWVVMLGPTGSLIYLVITHATLPAFVFMLCVFSILLLKHFHDLRVLPRCEVMTRQQTAGHLTGRLNIINPDPPRFISIAS